MDSSIYFKLNKILMITMLRMTDIHLLCPALSCHSNVAYIADRNYGGVSYILEWSVVFKINCVCSALKIIITAEESKCFSCVEVVCVKLRVYTGNKCINFSRRYFSRRYFTCYMCYLLIYDIQSVTSMQNKHITLCFML